MPRLDSMEGQNRGHRAEGKDAGHGEVAAVKEDFGTGVAQLLNGSAGSLLFIVGVGENAKQHGKCWPVIRPL